MRKAAVVTALALVLPHAVAEEESGPVHAIVGVRVFVGDGSIREGATVVLRGGTIAALGPAAEVAVPDDAVVTEGKGRTLLPGLCDLHVHLTGPAGPFDAPRHGDPALRAAQTAACGVTAVLDLNASESLVFGLRAAERGGALPGVPRIFAAGAAITAPGGHGTEAGFPARILADVERAGAEVASLAERRADVVKVICDAGGWGGLPPRPALGAAALRAIVVAAHERGLKVVVHAVDVERAVAAVRAGADALAHLPLAGDDDRPLLEALRETGAALIPTLAVYRALFDVLDDDAFLADPLVRQYVDPRVRLQLRDPEWRAAEATVQRAGWFRARWPLALERVQRLHAAGVPILPGSDAGMPATFHGVALHRELAALVEAGLAPQVVLAAATRDAARFLGSGDRFGTVEVGKAADLLLVEGNPMRRIEDTRKVVRVWRDGVLLDGGAVAARLVPADLPPPDPATVATAPVVLFDFEDPAGTLPPHQVTAGGSGGDASPAAAECVLDYGEGNPTCFLRLAGNVVFRPPSGGFAGVSLTLDARRGQLTDLRPYRALRFRARSNERRAFRVLVRAANVRDFDFHGAGFVAGPEWRTYRIGFDALGQIGFGKRVPLDLERVAAVEFLSATGEEGVFRLDVDDVEVVP